MIVCMNPETPSKALQELASVNQIRLVHTGLQPWMSVDDWKLTSNGILQDTLKYILDDRNSPVLILDTFNFFVGVLRKVQCWSYSSIISEYKMYAGAAAHYKTETFLEILKVRCIEHEAVDSRRDDSIPLITLSEQDHEDPSSRNMPGQLVTFILPPWSYLPEWFQFQWRLICSKEPPQ